MENKIKSLRPLKKFIEGNCKGFYFAHYLQIIDKDGSKTLPIEMNIGTAEENDADVFIDKDGYAYITEYTESIDYSIIPKSDEVLLSESSIDFEEMEMPTPCIHCNTVFDLYDGYGSAKWHLNTTICKDCFHDEANEIAKDEAIEELKYTISDLKQTIIDAANELKESEKRLKELEKI